MEAHVRVGRPLIPPGGVCWKSVTLPKLHVTYWLWARRHH